ncbi:MAG: recombinase family protein [Dolichospermum sp.]
MKLVGYVRVSSEGQADNTSLEDQELKIQAYCSALNHELVGLYQDVQSGGKSENRKGLQAAIADMLAGKADGLIVLKLDRLGRRASDVLTLIDKELQPNNKALIVIDMNMDTSTATGKLVLTMLAGVAEFEKSQINERTANGKKARAKTSEYANGGQPKFGHKADNKNLVVDEKEQQIIDVIRRHHKSGKSQRQIADYLNNQGILSKQGKQWSSTTVGRVLERLYPKAA